MKDPFKLPKVLAPEGVIPGAVAKEEQLHLVKRMAGSGLGRHLLDREVKWICLDCSGLWIEFTMDYRVKLLCRSLVSSMDLKQAAEAVYLSEEEAEALLDNEDARNYVSLLLEEQLGDTAITPEIFRSRVLKIQEGVQSGKIKADQASVALKALELYAKVSGYLVQQQAKERKTHAEGFSPG